MIAESDALHFGLPAQARQMLLAMALVVFAVWAIAVHPDPAPQVEEAPNIAPVIAATQQLSLATTPRGH